MTSTLDAISDLRKFQQTLNLVSRAALYTEVLLTQLNAAGAPYQLELYSLNDQWVFKTPGGGKVRYDMPQFEEAIATFLAALVTEAQNAARTD
jgi:hypothetical protein